MRTAASHADDWVLLTGVTGFVGAALADELMRRNHRLLCLVRADRPAEARERVRQALQPWTSDVEHLFETGRIAVLRGDLHAPAAGVDRSVRAALKGRISALVHAAGSTRFVSSATGEPERTNIEGTVHVLELAAQLGCQNWHVISTAYVAGRQPEAIETVTESQPAFHNDYEQSKWQMERLAQDASRQQQAALTIYRPSVVVGHSETGQATRFVGLYYLFRATAMLARAAEQHPEIDRHALPIRIPAVSGARPNIICVDDMARAFGDIFERPAANGGVYHLTHPHPPTNTEIRTALEACYDVSGGTFSDEPARPAPSTTPDDNVTALFQDLFNEMTTQVHDYLFDAPRFDRTQTDRFVRQPPAPWTAERLRRLIETAESAAWRSTDPDRQAPDDSSAIESYFRDFLPSHIATSQLAAAEQVELTVRFIIGRRPEGRWWCRFRGGRVDAVEPGDDQPADVTYKTSAARFWAAVAGDITGAELFLSGQAQIEGDIEIALKFAVILEEFVREHPYRRGEKT